MTQNFKEGRRAQIVNALRDAAEQQATPVQPKSEAQIESERSAAAVALNAVFLACGIDVVDPASASAKWKLPKNSTF